ncbi:alpha-2,8-sialyltransferase 8F-like [Conger conger]|uniref:alpha-2,8-sialyltransferase 8F-like n=1 Tax=Conger conger TaxID=82655 RepID=UPI002A5A10FE|nr:alpha-2,8-sialyltransferase 8F-like [Conger conger]
MKQLMSCPWKVNITQKERYRVELYYSCNATEDLILTQQNIALGQKITYDGEIRVKVVDDALLKMLPETTPWRTGGHLGRCAVVGNGGILRNSSCGSQINKADFVIRLNLAPITLSQDVGVKTSLITANPSQIERNYPNMKKHRRRLARDLSLYGGAPLLMPAFAYRLCTGISFRVHQALRFLNPQQKVVFFNPNYLRDLHHYWRRRGQRAFRLSTGLMLASVALELCDEVHLYGFWPFNFDLSLKQLSHHYYDNVGPRRRAHSMPQEFLQLLKMHVKGAINLHVGKCQ